RRTRSAAATSPLRCSQPQTRATAPHASGPAESPANETPETTAAATRSAATPHQATPPAATPSPATPPDTQSATTARSAAPSPKAAQSPRASSRNNKQVSPSCEGSYCATAAPVYLIYALAMKPLGSCVMFAVAVLFGAGLGVPASAQQPGAAPAGE